MSLTAAKMTGSLKEQLLEEERELRAELEAVEKDKKRAGKKGKKED